MDKIYNIESIDFDADDIIIKIDGKVHKFPLTQHSTKLLNATVMQRQNFRISPSGYGIHWPDLDEDLSIDGLLGIRHHPAKDKKVS
ncbi:MAG: DUF2442 domain-containing protein [Spirochaetales bacterium]|nr:DUF2442 domain-containing protein [Spirochaetales bacterium]